MGLVALWHMVFLDQGSNPYLLHWQASRFFATEPPEKPQRSFLLFWLYQVLVADVGFCSLTQGSNPGPLHRECGVLTTGTPGKFPEIFLYYILVLPFSISLLWTPAGSDDNSTLALGESQARVNSFLLQRFFEAYQQLETYLSAGVGAVKEVYGRGNHHFL